MPTAHEVEFIVVSGKEIPAALAICPHCKVLDLGTVFNTKVSPIEAICTKDHEWTIDIVAH